VSWRAPASHVALLLAPLRQLLAAIGCARPNPLLAGHAERQSAEELPSASCVVDVGGSDGSTACAATTAWSAAVPMARRAWNAMSAGACWPATCAISPLLKHTTSCPLSNRRRELDGMAMQLAPLCTDRSLKTQEISVLVHFVPLARTGAPRLHRHVDASSSSLIGPFYSHVRGKPLDLETEQILHPCPLPPIPSHRC
jgi:hypothetical protein